jgi:hypothetical protein
MTLNSMTLADQDMSASQYRTHLVAVQPYIRRHAAVLRVVGTELAVVQLWTRVSKCASCPRLPVSVNVNEFVAFVAFHGVLFDC